MAQRRGGGTADRAARGDRRAEKELAFAQRKLEENYGKVCTQLGAWRSAVEKTQEVLVWRRPVPAALLYIAVHYLFYYFAATEEGFLTQLSHLLFWLLVGDAVWRAATRDGQGLQGEDNSGSSSAVRRRLGQFKRKKMSGVVAFERALLLYHEERSSQELVPFEVICLALAQLWMWLDNIWLALRHWSIHDPLMFSVFLAVPGLILAVVGKYIPTIFLLYVLVMGFIVWPYICYHDLIQKTSTLISTHFPILIQKMAALWQFVKDLLHRDQEALSEFSLVGGGGQGREEDANTQEMLGSELDRALREGGGEGVMSGEGVRREEGARGGGVGESRVRQRVVRRADPGMSVLQDSVLGMRHDAFHDVEDSLASFGPGPGDFPSISTIDNSMSLLLPQFPAEDTDHHSHTPHTPHLTTIQESEEVVREGLNPPEDSAELDFGHHPGPRHRLVTHTDSAPQRVTRPHPLAQYSVSSPIVGYSSSQGQLHQPSNWTPPPSYEEVVSSQDNIQAGSYGFQHHQQSAVDRDVRQKRVPRNSSTPFFSQQQ